MHHCAHLLNHKEETEIKILFGAFLDLLMLKDGDGVAFWSLNVSILRVAGKYFLCLTFRKAGKCYCAGNCLSHEIQPTVTDHNSV